MRKKSFLLLLAIACIAGKGHAQDKTCSADEARKRLIAQHPELLQIEADYENQIQAGLKKIDLRRVAKTTTTDMSGVDSFWYDIPIVVHVVHDYNIYSLGAPGGDYITDDQVFEAVKSWNKVYAKQNSDTSFVIQPFKKYIGNPHIRLHLATIDPAGHPTKGITRTRSYLTYVGGDQAKFEDWQPSSYINIWFINKMSGDHNNAAAYAYQPASVTFIPYYDGVISLAEYMDNSKTINHEIGHSFNLSHTWGNTNNPALECGDDNVDDTPPTKGHNPGCNDVARYDTACCQSYYKIYTDDAGHINLVNYPDTANSENIMDYTYCARMFTKGQVQRMHVALNNTVGGRNNLWDPANLAATGALAPVPDLKPIPDFLVTPLSYSGYMNRNGNFVIPGNSVKFTNETWNDTLTHLVWTFSNGADKPTDTSRVSLLNKFTDGGWVTISMTASGNHTGDSTRTWNNSVYVANPTAQDPNGYLQEFDAAGDRDQWPSFNYYNNDFKWQLTNTGVYDNTSMMYNGFDAHYNPSTFTYPITGNPQGDVDDLYARPMDLSSTRYLNFFYAGASRTSVSTDINDTLIIEYSANHSNTWTRITAMTKSELNNNGSHVTPFVPFGAAQWASRSIDLPSGAKSPYTIVRFRYKPNVGVDGLSSGNNFYLDRIYFSNIPVGVNEAAMATIDVAVVPNPTHGNAYVVVKDVNNATAQVVVSDITGKVVYTTSQQVSGKTAQIEIPHSVIAVQGMYLVQTTTGNQTNTQKLVVY